MAQTKRRSDPTHPSVWGGLGLALAGLLLATYAYTGSRVYDITFFFVAILGGFLALGGILTSAWGRALGASRARRSRMEARSPIAASPAPPTVAEPRSKRSFKERMAAAREKRSAAQATPKPVFAFRRKKDETPPEPATESDPIVSIVPKGSEGDRKARITLECPKCSTLFTAEGTRPLRVVCPQCAYSAEV